MLKIHGRKQLVWRIKGYPILVVYIIKGLWWFRVFGYGLRAKNLKLYGLLFSEREGYAKYYRIGNWSFKALKGWGIVK